LLAALFALFFFREVVDKWNKENNGFWFVCQFLSKNSSLQVLPYSPSALFSNKNHIYKPHEKRKKFYSYFPGSTAAQKFTPPKK